MATQKNIALFDNLAAPSASAQALVYDSGQANLVDRTRLVLLSTIASTIGGVFLSVGSPEGVITTNGPALAITALGGLWARPVATAGNTGWIELLAE